MKTRIKKPFKRLWLVMVYMAILSGCSNAPTNSLFESWKKEAYSAYRLPPPTNNVGVLPTLLQTVPATRQSKKRVYQAHASVQQSRAAPKHVDKKEQQFIEQYYGL